MNISESIRSFVRKEIVLVISVAAALISCIFVVPDAAYFSYIDWHTLALLLSLMVVVAGLRFLGVIRIMGEWVVSHMRSKMMIASSLIGLTFACSMFITNDVALITFVPFAIVVMHRAKMDVFMGPVVALIGLELAGSAASTGCIVGDSVTTGTVITFLVTLAVAVFGSVLFRGFFSTIPILIAIICGYIAGVLTGVIETQTIIDALHTSFISIPNFQTPKFDINAILIILPVLLVIANEHIGHQLVTGKVIGRDLLKDPGLHRSLFADNFSTMISGFIGSVPTTTYGENIGVMAITKVYSVRVIGGAAVLSIICSFVGPLAALIQTIPGPVIGGISFLLYGMIGTSGLRILVDNHVDYSKNRNMILTSVIFVTGLSGVTLALGDVSLSGMTLAAIVGMIMSLVFYAFDKFHLSNDA